MSVSARITSAEFDSMVERGAFDGIGPRKIELIQGELRFMNPAGPIHDDYIDFLNRWSHEQTDGAEVTVRVQCSFACGEHRPEPDIMWLKPRRYGRTRPTAADVLLLIEVSDTSLAPDLKDKADLYAECGIVEYWVIDVAASQIQVMTESDGKHYAKIEMIIPPAHLSPRCLPHTKLMTAELFLPPTT